MAILEAGFGDATAVLALPEPYRRRLRTSNGMERLNEEVRRRERVIRIFPNRESAIRLLGAVFIERHEQWSTGHHYFDMAAYWQWRQARDAAPPQGGHDADGVREATKQSTGVANFQQALDATEITPEATRSTTSIGRLCPAGWPMVSGLSMRVCDISQ